MSEISYDATNQLRQAIIDQQIWEQLEKGHLECETLGITGYKDTYVSASAKIDADVAPPEVRERLGLDEESASRCYGINVVAGKRLAGKTGNRWLEDTGENSMIVRLSTIGSPTDGTGKWIHMDYLLSSAEVSDQSDMPPITHVRAHLIDETEMMRAIYKASQEDRSVFGSVYEQTPVDPETEEPDPKMLLEETRDADIAKLVTSTPQEAEKVSTEHAINRGMAEFQSVIPVTEPEVIALAGLVRGLQLERDL